MLAPSLVHPKCINCFHVMAQVDHTYFCANIDCTAPGTFTHDGRPQDRRLFEKIRSVDRGLIRSLIATTIRDEGDFIPSSLNLIQAIKQASAQHKKGGLYVHVGNATRASDGVTVEKVYLHLYPFEVKLWTRDLEEFDQPDRFIPLPHAPAMLFP